MLFTFTFHNVSISTRSSKCHFCFHQIFTFHNVSISTYRNLMRDKIWRSLHSTMYLFLRSHRHGYLLQVLSLHSTMYLFLLIPPPPYKEHDISLHSTMYLFLRLVVLNIHSLIELYIPQCIYFYVLRPCRLFVIKLCFTFHNVSISTLYLNTKALNRWLYIPQCIYFYE